MVVVVCLGRTSYRWFHSTVVVIDLLDSSGFRLAGNLSGSSGLSLLLKFLPPHVLFHELRTQSTYMVRVICPVVRARSQAARIRGLRLAT